MLAISEIGCTPPPKKVLYGVRLKSTRRSEPRGFVKTKFRGPEIKNLDRGCALPAGADEPGSLEGWLELAEDEILLEAVFDYWEDEGGPLVTIDVSTSLGAWSSRCEATMPRCRCIS